MTVVHAGPLVGMDTPLGFFTNVASRLLRSEMNLDLNQIQIWPTNQYTPAVHRLLQVSANLYDATTNRTVPGTTNGLGFPSVFRPIFARPSNASNAPIYICGYAEITNANMAYAGTAPQMLDPYSASDRANFMPLRRPMFYGIPVIIGARKGWPNFNEFAMETQVQVVRRLQFFRDPANHDPDSSPVVGTNQMYLLCISNVLGAQGWNSYCNAFSRSLDVIAVADVITVLSNETGQVLLGSTGAPTYFAGVLTTNSWSAFNGVSDPAVQASFVVPLLTNFFCLTNSEYRFQPSPQFVGLTGIIESNLPSRFPIPRWYLSLRTRLRFILVDKDAGRIVDYVNLDSARDPTQPLMDITTNLMADGVCSGLKDPGDGSEWCTNRLGGSTVDLVPPYGVLNQISICLGDFGMNTPQMVNWNNFIVGSPVGGDVKKTIDWFRYQFGYSPFYYSGTIFYKSNVFCAPFSPVRLLYFSTRWQANDPLVHYTIPDLAASLSLLERRITVDNDPCAMADFEQGNGVTDLYRPWGSSGKGQFSDFDMAAFNIAVEDPVPIGVLATHPDLVGRSDDWDFPTNQTSGFGWLGRVHRGTPWQTIYLKSAGVDASLWQQWTGVSDAGAAQLMQPTNDWRLASLLLPLLNTNAPGNLSSLNQSGEAGWRHLLDGLIVLTNDSFEQLDAAVMSSNSPQAAAIAAGLDAARRSGRGGYFCGIGDILATPALSDASPWLDTRDSDLTWTLTDEAYEMIPSQLLPLLRPDSIGSVVSSANPVQIQFTGLDAWHYAVETSSNLVDWVAVSTNYYPSNGIFTFTEAAPASSAARFYRSILLP
jgi:hypothetical protein